MPKLNLVIRASRPNADGSYNIKCSIAAHGRTCFLPTRFNVASAREWRNGKVVRRSDADVMNRKLALMLLEYEDWLADNPKTDGMSAREVRDFLMRYRNRSGLVADFGERYIDALKRNGQVSYASNMGYSLRYLVDCFGESLRFDDISLAALHRWEEFLYGLNQSSTTVNIRMSHLKALVNSAVDEGEVEYCVSPFRKYRMPSKCVRDLCISAGELVALRDAVFEGVSARRFEVARDLFMLSFYCAGINLTDIMSADMGGDVLRFVRKKTQLRRQGEKEVSITLIPEAKAIVEKYMRDGRLDFGYCFSDYGQFRSFVTKSLNRIGEQLGFDKRLMFYSARKTFCQFGHEIGVPLYILEYAIGHTIKDANNRPIFNYIRIMRDQADGAIRRIVDHVFERDLF